MNEIIEEIQGESKAQATKDNYARRGAAFVTWPKKSYPACWGSKNSVQLSSVTTLMICEYLAKTSKNKNGIDVDYCAVI
jgi:hypothetical protein